MELENSLSEAIELAGTVIGQVPEQFRQASYPIVLEAAIHGSIGNGFRTMAAVDERKATPFAESDIIERPANELLARMKPDRLIDAVILLCAHLEAHSEMITTETVRRLFDQTKRDAPRNTADMLRQLVKRGHLTSVEKQGRSAVFEITTLGREFVNSRLEEIVVESGS